MNFRQILKKIVIILPLTCLFAFIYWSEHEDGYVYYYQQSQQTDKKGIPFIVLDHLYWEVGKWDYRNGSYYYNLESLPFITYSNDEGEYSYTLQGIGVKDTILLYYPNGSKDAIFYYFNEEFEVIDKQPYSSGSQPITDEDRAFVQKALKITTQQLMDELNKPILNIQWLFDWTLKGHQSEKIWFVSLISSLVTWLGFRGLKTFFIKHRKKKDILHSRTP